MAGVRLSGHLSVGLLLLVELLAACSKTEDEARARTIPEASVTAPDAGAPQAASVASVSHGRLFECDDFTMTRLQGPSDQSAAETDLVGGFVSGFLERNKAASRISKPCKDAFPTSPVLATCIAHISSQLTKADSRVALGTYEVLMASRYYDPDALTSDDSYMKGCAEMKGDWQAVDKNSEEYKAAVRVRSSEK
jgi:hypothetical protein